MYGGADHFLLHPSIPSYPGFSHYRVLRLGYTWNFSFEPTLASEYQKLTGGLMPPLLENSLIDGIKTRDRIDSFNLFKAAQAEQYAAYSKTNPSNRELIQFRTKQTEAYDFYVGEVHKGLLRSQKPKVGRYECFYENKADFKVVCKKIEKEED